MPAFRRSPTARAHRWRRRGVLALGLVFFVVFAGCGDDDMTVDAEVGTDAGRDGGTPPTPDGGTRAPILDPAIFDCTSASATDFDLVPPRASVIPIACGLDPTCLTTQISGHRGAGGELGRIAPEDTLSAFRAAIALGIEYLETDPRPTSDGVIVNMHDPKVDRTTNGVGRVDMLTFDEVRALTIETTLPGDYGCERVPTLEEILRTARGRAIVLIDANKTDRVDLLVGAVHAADAVEWAIFDTSSLDKIDRALAIEPGLHFMIRPNSIDQIAPQMDHFAPNVPAIVELRINDVAVGSPLVVARGSRVMSDVFGADLAANLTGDLSGYESALDDGSHILQSDRPDLVLGLLQSRGLR